MTKIVINRDYGGFGLSDDVVAQYADQKGVRFEDVDYYEIDRDDPVLIQIIEETGPDLSGGRYASLAIVEIPDDVKWQIEEYDGREWIAEEHRTWH